MEKSDQPTRFEDKKRGNMIRVCIRFFQAIQVQGSAEDFATRANMGKRQVYRWIKAAEKEGYTGADWRPSEPVAVEV